MRSREYYERLVRHLDRSGETPGAAAILDLLAEAERRREPDFRCEARIHTGPGHQSTRRCDRRDPHDLDDEHYVTAIIYDWTGPEAYSDS